MVENAVHLAYQRIYYPMRNMNFFSLADLNREIKKLLEGYNNLLFQRKHASRKELFQSVERSFLKPLPETAYQIKDYRRAKVQKMGFVYFSPDKSYYSVPYRYKGQRTLIHYTSSMVEVYYNHQRIALHIRKPGKGNYNIIEDHLSSTHKAYSDWSPEYFKNKASSHGENVLAVVKNILEESDYPEIGYKRIMGIIQLHRDYGSQRLNNACQIALIAGISSYKRISNILKNNMDKTPPDIEKNDPPHIPRHGNIRGPKNYE